MGACEKVMISERNVHIVVMMGLAEISKSAALDITKCKVKGIVDRLTFFQTITLLV
jgi:hypothetical protein